MSNLSDVVNKKRKHRVLNRNERKKNVNAQ